MRRRVAQRHKQKALPADEPTLRAFVAVEVPDLAGNQPWTPVMVGDPRHLCDAQGRPAVFLPARVRQTGHALRRAVPDVPSVIWGTRPGGLGISGRMREEPMWEDVLETVFAGEPVRVVRVIHDPLVGDEAMEVTFNDHSQVRIAFRNELPTGLTSAELSEWARTRTLTGAERWFNTIVEDLYARATKKEIDVDLPYIEEDGTVQCPRTAGLIQVVTDGPGGRALGLVKSSREKLTAALARKIAAHLDAQRVTSRDEASAAWDARTEAEQDLLRTREQVANRIEAFSSEPGDPDGQA